MVFAGFGFSIAEADLRALCDCTFLGTEALKAVDAAHECGFPATSKHNLSVAELEGLVRDGDYPIVFVNFWPLGDTDEQHALVVIEMDEDYVTVLDPISGEESLAREDFLQAWAWQRCLTIIVRLPDSLHP